MVESVQSHDDATVLMADAILLPKGLTYDQALIVKGETITAIEPIKSVSATYPQAKRVDLPGQVIMPGFVNAHQHGSGLTSISAWQS